MSDLRDKNSQKDTCLRGIQYNLNFNEIFALYFLSFKLISTFCVNIKRTKIEEILRYLSYEGRFLGDHI